MPTYDYRCQRCHKIFEAFQNISAAPLKKCRFCGGQVMRLISRGGGFIFKGKGFYATDYRSREYRRRAKEDDESARGKKEKKPKKEEKK